MTGNWKFKCVLVGLLVVVMFSVYQFNQSSNDRAPAWLRLERRHGPALPAAMLQSLKTLLQQIELDTNDSGQPLGSLIYFVITKNNKPMLACNLEIIRNPGFAPASQFPVERGTTDQSIVGYYLLDGTPLNFTLKHQRARSNAAFLAIETQEPLAPGASISLLRVEQQPLDLDLDVNGFCRQRFPRVSRNSSAIHAVAICLPANTSLQTYRPSDGAYISTKNALLVGWINRRLDSRVPAPSITFKLP